MVIGAIIIACLIWVSYRTISFGWGIGGCPAYRKDAETLYGKDIKRFARNHRFVPREARRIASLLRDMEKYGKQFRGRAFPRYEEYPQYRELIELGEKLSSRGGRNLMLVAALWAVQKWKPNRLIGPSLEWGDGISTLQMLWDDVGDWHPQYFDGSWDD
jgi:hypothetical protein